MLTPTRAAVVERRFTFFQRLGALDRRGMHLVDPWLIGAGIGLSDEETEGVLASLAGVGWIARQRRGGEERVALTVRGLTRL